MPSWIYSKIENLGLIRINCEYHTNIDINNFEPHFNCIPSEGPQTKVIMIIVTIVPPEQWSAEGNIIIGVTSGDRWLELET